MYFDESVSRQMDADEESEKSAEVTAPARWRPQDWRQGKSMPIPFRIWPAHLAELKRIAEDIGQAVPATVPDALRWLIEEHHSRSSRRHERPG